MTTTLAPQRRAAPTRKLLQGTDSTARQPRGVYVVSEPGCMNPAAGAYEHIQVGIRELSGHFELIAQVPEVLPSRSQQSGASSSQSSAPSRWRRSAIFGALRDTKELFENFRRAIRQLREVRKSKPDFCYIRAAFLDPLPLLLKWTKTCHVFIEANGLQFETRAARFRSLLNPLHRVFEKATYKRADHVFFVGSYGDYWKLRRPNWTNVENGAEREFVDEFTDQRTLSSEQVHVCIVACLTKHHEPWIVTEAFRQLPQQLRQRCLLHLIGSGFEQLKTDVDGIVEIIDHGFLDREQLSKTLKTMHIGLIPGCPEHQSQMKMLDYGAAKLLTIVPSTHNLRKWFRPSETLFFRPRDPASLAQQLAQACESGDSDNRGESLHQKIATDFTWDRIFDRKAATILKQVHSKTSIHNQPAQQSPSTT